MKVSKKRILALSHVADIMGGAERSLIELIKDLTNKGHICKVIVPKEGSVRSRLLVAGAEVVVINFDWWMKTKQDPHNFQELQANNALALAKIHKEIRSFKPDYTVTNTSVAPWLAVASATLEVPHIWVLRELLEDKGQFIYRLGMDKTLEIIDSLSAKIFSNSRFMQEYYDDLLPSHTGKIGVIRPFVQKQEVGEKIILDSPAVVCVGQVKEAKGQLDLIKAASILKRQNFDIKLYFVGKAESLEYVEKLKKIHEEDGVTAEFFDYKTNPFDYMTAADIVVVPSPNEPFGRVTLEAMQSGSPVIGVASGGTKEIIRNNETGLLYKRGDVQGLANKIKLLLKDKALTKKIAVKALEEVKKVNTTRNSHREFINYLNSPGAETNLKKAASLVITEDIFLNYLEINKELTDIKDGFENSLRILKEREKQLEHLKQMKDSLSWRITRPLRFFAKLNKVKVILKGFPIRLYKRLLLRGHFRVRSLIHTRHTLNYDKIAVVMCLWQRIDRLPEIIEMLEEQATNKKIDLYLWNNNFSKRRQILQMVNAINISGAIASINIANSIINIGGFGRFYLTRKIRNKYHYVIFLDDDQIVEKTFIEDVNEYLEPRKISSFWAFKMDSNNYADRIAVSPGEDADYCGTGGMLIDTSIFEDNNLFKCPEEYWFIEDVWLSFYAKKAGWQLTALPIEIKFVVDGKDQGILLNPKKSYFYKELSRDQ